MKICFFIDNIHYLGGAQRCTIRLANELSRNGDDVTVLYNNKDKKNNYNEYGLDSEVKLEYVKGTDVIAKVLFCWVKLFEFINSHTLLFEHNYNFLKFVYYGRNIFAIKRLQRKIDAENYDYVIGVGAIYSMVLTMLKKNRTKFIGWQHTTSARHFEINNFLLWHQESVFNNALSYLDRYIVLTKSDADYIFKKFGKKVDVIYNPTSFKTSIKEYSEKKTIIAVGRYHSVKGFDLLVEAFNIFHIKKPEWKLKIVGEGTERENLQQMINKFELQNFVILTGKTNNIINEYKESDFLVLSSRMEGMPMTVLEAMECGLPIISFDLPCIREMIDSSQGIIVEYANVVKLAEAMEKLASDQKLREYLGRASKIKAEQFDVSRILKSWKNILKM